MTGPTRPLSSGSNLTLGELNFQGTLSTYNTVVYLEIQSFY